MDFISGFFRDGFVSGDYTYKTIHIITLVLLVLSLVILPILLRNKSKNQIFDWMRVIAIPALFIHLVREITVVINGGEVFRNLWSFYLCNINTLVLCFLIVLGVRKGLEFFIVTGLLGGLITFAMPQGIFTDQYLTIGILDSILSHYAIVVIPFVLLTTGAYNLNIKKFWQVILGYLLVVLNAEVIQRLFLTEYSDYLYFNSDIPFTIPGVPQFLIISVLILVATLLIYGINYLVKYLIMKRKHHTTNYKQA